MHLTPFATSRRDPWCRAKSGCGPIVQCREFWCVSGLYCILTKLNSSMVISRLINRNLPQYLNNVMIRGYGYIG